MIWLIIIIALGMILLAELAGIDGINTYFIVNILHKKEHLSALIINIYL
tara:strand:+ start:14153 stop:14299 length:147 start_codon:yes stop_codon:yes gene_type:complete